jgi:lipopolysaccharide transport system permease protein
MKTVRRSPVGPDSRERPDISDMSRQAAGMNAEYDLSNSADGIPRDPHALTVESPSHPRGHRTAKADHRTPLLVIGSRQSPGLELRDLWHHRELFYILAWRDVKVRYKQSALGVTWALLQPLLTMIIFTLLFGRLARIPSEGEPYAIFSYAGLLPWTFFSGAVATSANSLVNSSNIITKVYFPRLLIPIAAVGAALVDLAIASLLLVVIMPFYGASFHLSMMMFFPLTALTALTAAGVGIYTSALNVKYRDIRHALPFAIQIWMFVTPVIYPVNFLPQRWRWALELNPLSGIIEGFRAAIFGHPLNWQGLAVSTAIAAGLFITGAYSFRKLERQFADVI